MILKEVIFFAGRGELMLDSNKILHNRKQEYGPVGALIHLADEAYIQNLKNHQKGDLEDIRKQIGDTRRWFGSGLSVIGSLMQGCGRLEGENLAGAGKLIREFGEVVYQLQDINERLFQTRNRNANDPAEYVLE